MAKSNGRPKANGVPKAKAAAKKKPTASPKGQGAGTASKADTKCAAFRAQTWKPGQSGNPKGGKRKPSLVAAIIRQLNKAEDLEADGVDRFDENGKPKRPPTSNELAAGLLEMALKGNLQALGALNTLLERLDGRVPIRAELTGRDGDAIEIRQSRDNIAGRIASQLVRAQASEDPPEPN